MYRMAAAISFLLVCNVAVAQIVLPGGGGGGGGGTTTIVEPQGRITLTANTPVMTASATAQTTLRYDCYHGNNVPRFNGSTDILETIASCEVTTAMQNTGTGVLNANGVFDVWWSSGANHICVATNGAGGGWASDTGGSNTARGTGYSQLDRSTRGFTTNKNALANCYNGTTNYGSISANQATYLGTIATDAGAAGSVSFTFGTAASGGGAGVHNVWNMYNRVQVVSTVTDNGVAYTYTTGTIRQARASTGNQVTFVSGLAEDGLTCVDNARVDTVGVSSASGDFGCGLDSTTTFLQQESLVFTNAASVFRASFSVTTAVTPQVGLHVLSANEIGDGSNANIFDINGKDVLSILFPM